MSKKLYVGNLPYSTTDESLHSLFSTVGNVESARIIIDKMSGRSKGFGFVEMSSDQEANDAISKFDGQEHEGRAMIVSEARPQEPREGGGGRGGGGRGGGGRGGFGGGGGGGGRGGFGGGGGGGRGGGDRY